MPLSDTGETRVNLSYSPQRMDEFDSFSAGLLVCLIY